MLYVSCMEWQSIFKSFFAGNMRYICIMNAGGNLNCWTKMVYAKINSLADYTSKKVNRVPPYIFIALQTIEPAWICLLPIIPRDISLNICFGIRKSKLTVVAGSYWPCFLTELNYSRRNLQKDIDVLQPTHWRPPLLSVLPTRSIDRFLGACIRSSMFVMAILTSGYSPIQTNALPDPGSNRTLPISLCPQSPTYSVQCDRTSPPLRHLSHRDRSELDVQKV